MKRRALSIAAAQFIFLYTAFAQISPDLYLEEPTDAKKLQRAIDWAVSTNGYVDCGTRVYTVDTGLVAKSQKDDFITFKMGGSGMWHQFEFTGTGSFLKTIGAKNCRIEGMGVRLWKPNSIGFEISHSLNVYSTSRNTYSFCRVQPVAEATGCTGFLVGSYPAGREGADTCNQTFVYCDVNYDAGGGSPLDRWRNCMAGKTVGWAFVGSNNLNESIEHSTASGCLIGVQCVGYLGYQAGGAGLMLNDVSGSFNGVFALIDGGFNFYWRNGRSEESTALLIHGAPLGAGRQKATVTLDNVFIDDVFNKDGLPGLTAPGEVIGLHSGSRYTLRGVGLWGQLSFGDPVTSKSIVLACNDPTARPTVEFNACLFRNGNPATEIAPTSIVPKEGTWVRVVDSAKATVSQAVTGISN